MGRLQAVVMDAVVVAALAFAGFLIATVAVPCPNDTCPLLMPLTVILVLIGLALYFGVGQILWHRTPGERVFLG